MKGCKDLCNKKTPHIDGVKVLRVPAWERGSICPALIYQRPVLLNERKTSISRTCNKNPHTQIPSSYQIRC